MAVLNKDVKMKELREMSDEELAKKLREAKLELMKLKSKKAIGVIEKPAAIRNTKRLIARILTILNEKQKGYKEVKVQ